LWAHVVAGCETPAVLDVGEAVLDLVTLASACFVLGIGKLQQDVRLLSYGGRRLDAIADDIAGETLHGIGRIAIITHQPAGAGGDRVARGRDQRVHMGAAGPGTAAVSPDLSRPSNSYLARPAL